MIMRITTLYQSYIVNTLQMEEMKEEKRRAAEEKRKNAKPWW